MNENVRDQLISLGVCLVLAVTLFLVPFFLIKNYNLYGWSNVLAFDGVCIMMFGAFMGLHRFGAFDFFVYGVRDIFFHMNPNPGPKPYKDYVDYRDQMMAKRKKHPPLFWSWIIVGALILIAGIIVRLVLKNQIA